MALMDDLQELNVQCSNCGATLQYENGSFQDCPLCGTRPTEQQIRAAAYFQKVEQTGTGSKFIVCKIHILQTI